MRRRRSSPPGVERVVVRRAAIRTRRRRAGSERLRAQGVDVEFVDSWEARVQNEAWRTWVRARRPFVIYKVAATLDGRVAVPGRALGDRRGEPSARPRAAGRRSTRSRSAAARRGPTGRASTRATSRRRRGQPRRLVFSRGPLPDGLDLELRTGPLADELRALAADGVQSLLLEGGPTLAAAFLEADLVDKLLALRRAGPRRATGRRPTAPLPSPRTLSHLTARPVGEDVLLEAYVHDP